MTMPTTNPGALRDIREKTRHKGLLRGLPSLTPIDHPATRAALARHTAHPDPVVREAVAWALSG